MLEKEEYKNSFLINFLLKHDDENKTHRTYNNYSPLKEKE
jgi:hypothetical protein